jgi:hypothetical protein
VSTLLAVDPSLRCTGVALFVDGRLTAAGVVRPAIKTGSPVDRAAQIAREVRSYVAQQGVSAWMSEIVLEWPQVYRAAKSKGDPNDLLGIAAVCGAVATYWPNSQITAYKPAEWAGQLPKATSHKQALASPRGRRVFGRLQGDEVLVWDQLRYHDAVDAVGIGLYHLGRLKPRRVLPGTSERAR